MESIRLFVDKILFAWVLPEVVTARLSRQLILYIFYGVFATLVDWGVFYLTAVALGLHYILSATLSFLFASTTNFIANKYLNFQNSSSRVAYQYAVHFAIGVVGLGIVYLLLYLFIDILGLGQMVSKMITSAFVAFYGFFAHKHITFNDRHFGN